MAEIAAGNPTMAAKRLQIVAGLRILALDDAVRYLATSYQARLGLPPRAQGDLLHLAFAVRYEVDYFVTWNCAHLANGQVVRRLI